MGEDEMRYNDDTFMPLRTTFTTTETRRDLTILPSASPFFPAERAAVDSSSQAAGQQILAIVTYRTTASAFPSDIPSIG